MWNLTNVEIIENYNIFPSIKVKIPEIFGSFLIITSFQFLAVSVFIVANENSIIN